MRASLGDDKLTYFGYSYGTFLGAIYADLFPDRIRALVLDAVVDQSITAQVDIKNQAAGFEIAFNAFLADCAADPGCAYYSGGDPGAAYDALMQTLDAQPIYGDGTIEVGAGIALLGVLAALYDETTGWPRLAEALALAEAGDGSGLLRPFLLHHRAVWRRLHGRTRAADRDQLRGCRAPDVRRKSGVAGGGGARGAAVRGTIGPAGDPLQLLAGGVAARAKAHHGDGVTTDPRRRDDGRPGDALRAGPIAGGAASQGVLLTLNAEQHTAYGGVSACIDDAVAAYLIDLIPPPDGTTCSSCASGAAAQIRRCGTTPGSRYSESKIRIMGGPTQAYHRLEVRS